MSTGDDPEAIRKATSDLMQASMKIGEYMYKNAQGPIEPDSVEEAA